MRPGLDLDLGHDRVLHDAGDQAGEPVADRRRRDVTGRELRGVAGELLGEPRQRRAVDRLPARRVGGRLDPAALGPAAHGVGADAEQVGCLFDPEGRHRASAYPQMRPSLVILRRNCCRSMRREQAAGALCVRVVGPTVGDDGPMSDVEPRPGQRRRPCRAAGGRALRGERAAGQAAARRREPVAPRRPAVRRLGRRARAVAAGPSHPSGPARPARGPVAGGRRCRGRRRRARAADVRPRLDARLGRLAAPQRRGRADRRDRLGRLPRARRATRRAGHARDRRRGGRDRRADRSGAGVERLAGRRDRRGVRLLGGGQQPDAQGVPDGRDVARGGQGWGGGADEPGARPGARRSPAVGGDDRRRARARLRRVRAEPRAVHRRHAARGHRPCGCVLLGRPVLRGGPRGRARGPAHLAARGRRGRSWPSASGCTSARSTRTSTPTPP